jgi:N6-adenosine-specific RNA methylase IME4
VLDGRNRQRACDEAEVDCIYQPFPADQDPLAFVIDKNLRRRHLDESQRAYVAAKLANLGEGRPPEKTAQICAVSQDRAAKMLNVSRRSVQHAAAVRSGAAPELQHAVETGKISVSAAAQALRLAPEKQREVAERAEAGEERAARNVIKREGRAVRERDLGEKQRALPDKKYGVIVWDPQWGRTVYSQETGMDRHAANHYPVAQGDEATQDDEIKALDVASIAAPDSVLGLWCTEPWRGEAVARSQGFEPVAYFVWVKDIVVEEPAANGMLRSGQKLKVVGAAGMGFWNRDRCEIMLICTRGKPICPAQGTQGERVWFARRGEHATKRDESHSDKPECSLEWFERHWPNTPKIELNRRGPPRPGWDCWGNEAEPAHAGDELRESAAQMIAPTVPHEISLLNQTENQHPPISAESADLAAAQNDFEIP